MTFEFDQQAPLDESRSYDLLPEGWYLAHFTAGDVKPLKSGNGLGLTLEAQVLQASHKGRKLWIHLNVAHTNTTVQDIAQRQLTQIKMATGVSGKVDGPAPLLRKPLRLQVVVRPEEGKYPAKNEVKSFGAAGAPESSVATNGSPTALTTAAPGQSPAAATAPWLKRTA
jgi:Protein of unknown function (DUF669)